MDRSPIVARRLFDRIEPVHAVTYFSPEARAELDGLSYRGFWIRHFRQRGMSPPAAALRAREQSAVAALRRYRVTDDDAAVAAELAAKAAARGDVGGRTVFAANRALDWPDHPLARLWHANILLREHRGGPPRGGNVPQRRGRGGKPSRSVTQG